MNQPRIKYLVYRIAGRAKYTKAAPLEGELDGFRIVADGEKARLYPAADFATQKDALVAAAPIVKNWEAMAATQHGPGAFCLRFDRSHSVDMCPTPGESRLAGSTTIRVVAEARLSSSGVAHHSRLPDLPAGMSFDGNAGLMLELFNMAASGRARWVDAGYFICTALHRLSERTRKGSKYQAASEALKVPESKLLKLHAAVGRSGGRKAGHGPPLTGKQATFVRETCRDLILRMARFEGGSDPNGSDRPER